MQGDDRRVGDHAAVVLDEGQLARRVLAADERRARRRDLHDLVGLPLEVQDAPHFVAERGDLVLVEDDHARRFRPARAAASRRQLPARASDALFLAEPALRAVAASDAAGVTTASPAARPLAADP
jgi:hypothetical protein